jgi:predicted DNA-binding transcriptional regulator YafY
MWLISVLLIFKKGVHVYLPTTRVLTVLELLQAHHRLNGPELAKRLEVDTRTVRRYIMMLQDLGIPVEAERGRYGSYRLRPGFRLPPLMFTDDEAFAITIGLIAARKLGLAATAPAVEGALAKLERILPPGLLEQVRALQQALSLSFFNAARIAPASKVVVTLSVARLQTRRVWMRYQSWQSEVTERALDPYGLVCRGGYWHVVGYCHLRKDLRTFRLDRIQHVEMRDETFQPPLDFDSVAHAARALASMPVGLSIDITLRTSLESARTQIPPEVAVLEEEAGGVRMRCYAENLDWIAYQLVGLRCKMIIHQPPELKEALCRLAERAAALSTCVVPHESQGDYNPGRPQGSPLQ